MKKFSLYTHHKKILTDTITPVTVYYKIRDKYPNSILLESGDYHKSHKNFSYICFNPIASIKVENEIISQTFPDGSATSLEITNDVNVVDEIYNFTKKFDTKSEENFKFINNGIFGYTAYDAVRYFEDVEISKKDDSVVIPDMYYAVYQNIIAINHFKNEAYIFAHCYEDTPNNTDAIDKLINVQNFASYNFNSKGDIKSNLTDDEFRENVEVARKHCQRGDVFQLVLSRRFSQEFTGDDFNIYRALRSINPSPYLFYFDYGDFKIFGSSPEAQLIVTDGLAEIHPIAGTFKRTGDEQQDEILAEELKKDDKENAEHVMLVDLARNDLSRNGNNVTVEKDREIQFYSHVIHLVSKVTATKKNNSSTLQIAADTFPAGTLSGAPKHRAMQLISKYENCNRSFYGGALGFMDFEGNFNHAIIIRSFLSKNHELIFQAGAGIVSKSNPKNELQEINNKLGALNKALELAEKI